MSKPRFHIGIIAGSFLLTLLFSAAVWFFFFSSKQPASTLILTEGFDFRFLRISNETLSEPKIGSKIDLAKLEASNAALTAAGRKNGLKLFVFIDPLCPACNFSTDLMRDVRQTTTEMDITYLPIV
jgi:hypothetical protein